MTIAAARRRAVWPARIVALAVTATGLAASGSALSRGPAAAASSVLFTTVGATFLAVAVLIIERKPGNRVGPLMFVLGVVLAGYIALDAYVRQPDRPPYAALAAWAVGLFDGVWFTVLGLIFLWFPDGRPPSPRWWVVPWLDGVMIAAFVLGHGFTPGPITYYADLGGFENPFGVPGFPGDLFLNAGYIVAAVSTALAAFSLVVRWRRAGVVERTQLKWAASTAPLVALAVGAYYVFFGVGYNEVADLAVSTAIGLFGLAIGVAILRYRLYEIDRIISRTISYGLVTASLVSVYGVAVLLLQTALGAFTGGATVAVAASTLVAAALFQPLRRRIQAAVDRRFNRARYDAERTVASFAAVLRDEVDPTEVRAALVTTVGSAIGPHTVAVWFRGEGR